MNGGLWELNCVRLKASTPRAAKTRQRLRGQGIDLLSAYLDGNSEVMERQGIKNQGQGILIGVYGMKKKWKRRREAGDGGKK